MSQSLLRFLHRCYVADSGGFGIADAFAAKVERRVVMEGAGDFLSATLPLVLGWQDASALHEQVRLYPVQKQLVLGAFFIAGRVRRAEANTETLCAPLVLYDVELRLEEDSKTAVVEIEFGRRRLNPDALESWLPDTRGLEFELPERWRPADVHRLAAHLHELHPELEPHTLAEFPKLTPERRLRELRRGSELRCASAAALLLIRRPRASRGVRTELETLAALPNKEYSRPLASFLADRAPADSSRAPRLLPPIPAILSRNQENALGNASTSTLSLIIGPPGTGKSFTLAAIALDHAARGESVLISTRSGAALDAVEERIQSLVEEPAGVIRVGDTKTLRALKKRLDQLLRGIWDRPEQDLTEALSRRLRELQLAIDTLEAKVERDARRHQRWGELSGAPGLGASWRRFWLAARLSRARLDEAFHDYDRRLDRFVELNRERLSQGLAIRVDRVLQAERVELQRFRRALGTRTDLRQRELFDQLNFDALLGAFPIWLGTTTHISDALPMRAELFDVVLIDEASQSDLASIAPLLQRARRAVLAGDPHQLRHVSFLSQRDLARFAREEGVPADQRAELDYRRVSALDRVESLIASQTLVSFLDEHFRSGPGLISFSNREFYGGQLKIMKARPDRSTGELRLMQVPGRRAEDGTNPLEAETIVNALAQRLQPGPDAPSVGVLSPFRAQVDTLNAMLHARLPQDAIERHRLIVGTAHELQGQERDLMLLSLCLDDDSHPAAFRFLDHADVFNVAVTRARREQEVYFSFAPENRPPGSLVTRYLRGRSQGEWMPDRRNAHDRFVVELADALQQRALQVWPMTALGGTHFDLVAGDGEHLLGIELVGYPGPSRDWQGLFELRIVRRAGFAVTVASYFDWQRDRGSVAARIEEQLRGV